MDFTWKQPEIFYKYKRVKIVATAEELQEERLTYLLKKDGSMDSRSAGSYFMNSWNWVKEEIPGTPEDDSEEDV